jgi:hypothetical protein
LCDTLKDEFQNVDAVRSLQSFVAMTVLQPNEALAGVAQMSRAARGSEPAHIAEVLIVLVKDSVEGIGGRARDDPGYHSFVAEMLPKVLHYHGSISEYSVGPKVLFEKARDQLCIDLFCILNTKYSGKVIELAHEPENALPAAPLKPESLQLASESTDVLRKRSPTQLREMPPRLVEMFQHAHPSFFWATTMPCP